MVRLFISVLLFFISCPAWAATWYVDINGADLYDVSKNPSGKCNGHSASLWVSGTNQACAVNSPDWVLGMGCANQGTDCAGGGVTPPIASGDTVYINGDNGSSQAQYPIGFDGSSSYWFQNSGHCKNTWTYDCTLGNLPAGTDAGHPTSIIGTGTHKPQLYALNYPSSTLNANNNYITLQNIEITDHIACAFNDPTGGCVRGWEGLYLGGDGLTLTNIYIHGMSTYGIETNTMGSATFNNLWIIGNGYGGMTIGNNNAVSVTGTLTFNQPIIEWNGCIEATPVTGGIDNPNNYTNCFGQGSGGYGDGLAFGPSGSQNAGNWSIIGPGSISWNTQDGVDSLHGIGSGTIQIDKMRLEGNAGQPIKVNGLTENITNNIIINNCGWWWGAAQTLSGAMYAGDSCRANGTSVRFNIANNVVANITNNTIIANNGAIVLESADVASVGCNGNTAIHVKNNIIDGGYNWLDDGTINAGGANSITAYIYNDGNDGNGSGTCGNLTWDEDYNIVRNTKTGNANCVGAHDKCGTSPGFVNTIPSGTSGGTQNTYYNSWSGITYAPITSGSAAKGSGIAGLTYWNTINDYYNNSRPTPSMGALEYNSIAANTFTPCFFTTDCSSGICAALTCSASALSNGSLCYQNSDCTSGTCTNGLCSSGGGGGSSTRDSFTNIKMSLITFK